MMIHIISALLGLSTSAAAAADVARSAAGPERWCGVFDYEGFASGAPMNISIDGAGATATVNQVWDRKAHGCHSCCPEVEAGLNVTRTATHIAFLGDEGVAQYYSFEAAFSAAGDGMAGNITHGGRTYGSFAAQRIGCPTILQNCSSTPTPAPPTPPGPPPPHAPVPVWPLPLRLDCTPPAPRANAPPELLASTVSITLTGAGAASAVAAQAAARYQLLLRGAGSTAGSVTEIAVAVEGADETLGQTTNYSYALHYAAAAAAHDDSSGAGLTVTASVASPFGLGYALETLLQLASPGAQRDCGGGFAVQDAPVYQHRGLLLDTARRFFPLALLESTIDAMAIFKLNVLHLHLVSLPHAAATRDAMIMHACFTYVSLTPLPPLLRILLTQNDANSVHRFRVESKVFPQLNQPQNCSECEFYSQDEIRGLVQYARLRGVRVIPEFELLSHATSICGPLKSAGIVCCGGKWGMLQLGDDPAGNTTRILSALLAEMVPLFPDRVFHIGGDETKYETTGPCTVNASRSLQQKIMKKLVALGKQPMGWQEILLETDAASSFPEAIIEPWSKAGIWAQMGHPAVEALPSSLYLDHAVTSAGSARAPGVWVDITAGAMNASNAHFLLGGEASMWSDQYQGTKHTPGHQSATCMLPSPASDAAFATSISATIWPRAAVAAGSFWRWEESLSPQTQPELFASVVAAANEILVARGIETCPCANATFNGCDSVTHCGVEYCNQTL